MNLRQSNQKLHAEINRLSIFYEQQITQYKLEITTINTQILTFKSRVTELERQPVSTSVSVNQLQEIETKWAAEHLRVIILLEEVNRLNQKSTDIDR